MPSSTPDLSPEEIARRRRAAELMGDVLPDSTTDDTDEGWGERPAPNRDEDYLRDVPPHHS